MRRGLIYKKKSINVKSGHHAYAVVKLYSLKTQNDEYRIENRLKCLAGWDDAVKDDDIVVVVVVLFAIIAINFVPGWPPFFILFFSSIVLRAPVLCASPQ